MDNIHMDRSIKKVRCFKELIEDTIIGGENYMKDNLKMEKKKVLEDKSTIQATIMKVNGIKTKKKVLGDIFLKIILFIMKVAGKTIRKKVILQ